MEHRDVPRGALESTPVFRDLSPATRAALAAGSRPREVGRNAPVFDEGDTCRWVYVLESGRVSCYRANADGREQILRVFERPGDTFCIASAFSTGIHIVSARSVTRTRLLLLDVLTVKRVAEEHPAFAVSLLGAAGQQMGTLVELAESLALKTATARLAKLLYELALGEGAPAGRDILVHRDRLREEEIAPLLGVVRVHVSRSLRNLAERGVIGLTREAVRIPDLDALKEVFDGNARRETTVHDTSAGEPRP